MLTSDCLLSDTERFYRMSPKLKSHTEKQTLLWLIGSGCVVSLLFCCVCSF